MKIEAYYKGRVGSLPNLQDLVYCLGINTNCKCNILMELSPKMNTHEPSMARDPKRKRGKPSEMLTSLQIVNRLQEELMKRNGKLCMKKP